MQIRAYVMDLIQHKHLKADDRLPSENELATQFGVSRITVKHALDSLVEDGTIYRIQGRGSFVAETGGEPLLYTKQSAAPGSLIAYIAPYLDNSFTARLLNGIEDELGKSGYKVIFSNSRGSQEKEKQLIREALALGVAGMLVFPVDGEKYNEEIVQLTMSGFPIVLIDRDLPGLSTHCVCSDHAGGAYMATQHLLSLGHQAVAFVSASTPSTASTEERLAGYEKALADEGIPILHRHRLQVSRIDDIIALLNDNPELTAVFAENSGVGQSVFEAAAKMGRSIPGELSVTFFDDFEFSNLSKTPPTVIVQEEQAIGMESAKLLISVISSKNPEKQKILLPTRLLQRQSTASPPPAKP
ncbi:GntR family transcriptional regulator [Paenibacillus filicis]|uniref:GntR family transcriptional regulator n=1 Tax=Paenibacillus filicis TaxID=669464 RepID=A0ABU9DFX2_9BACL